MRKIVIVGSPGAGKTTLAKELGAILDIKVFHLDRFFWHRDWERESRDTRIDILQNLIQEKQWIIEGTYLNTSQIHLDAADTIIFLDIHPLLCLLRVIKRHRDHRGVPRRDIPKDCTDKLTLLHIWKVLTFPLHEGGELKGNLRKVKFRKSKQIFWLRSSKEVEDFLAQLRQNMNGQRDLFHEKTPPQVTEFATT